MRLPLGLASILAFCAVVLRTMGGLSGPLKDATVSNLPAVSVAFFHLTWHLVTIFFLLAGLALGYLAFRPEKARELGLFIGLVVLAWTVAIAIMGLEVGWSPATLIPLIVTFLIGLLSILGSRKRTA